MPSGNATIEWPAGGARVLNAITNRMSAPLSTLLLPLELAYRGVMSARNTGYDKGVLKAHRVGVPVISVGNVVAGGAGKTPITRYLTTQLLARGRRPAILHGGYGTDEPKLHGEWNPGVIVLAAKDRVAAAGHAISRGADVILLDDAFQHRRLARDLDIVLLSAESENLRLLPRGPAREPLQSLKRGGFIIITRKSASPDASMILETQAHKVAPGIPTARVALGISTTLPRDPVVAVSSIARPDLFLAQLQQAGADVAHMLAYPDHYEYDYADAGYIQRSAQGKLIVTTAKDAVKLREVMPEQPIHVVEQQVQFESAEGVLMAMLENVL